MSLAGREASRRSMRVRYFGLSIQIAMPEDVAAEFCFRAEAHLCGNAGADNWHIEVLREDSGYRYQVARDGISRLRRGFHQWDDIAAPIPPLALLASRIAVQPAVVLVQDRSVVALRSGPDVSAVAIALMQLGWRLAGGRLLVVDRASGATLPCLAPLRLRGTRIELADALVGSRRLTRSTLGEPVLDVWPDRVTQLTSIDSRLPAATVLRVCRGGRSIGLQRHGMESPPGPGQAADVLVGLSHGTLSLPVGACAEEAALAVNERLGSEGEISCPDVSITNTAHRVGLSA